METRHIQFLNAVAEAGSISAASRTLGMTQSALSKIVARVEDELGARLFDRRARGVELNSYGRVFLERVNRIGMEMDDLVGEMRSIRTGVTGHVSFGAGETWERGILSRAIARSHELHPRLRVAVRTGSYTALVDDLWRGELSFILAQVRPEFDHDVLTVEPIRDTVLMVTARRGHPLFAAEGDVDAEALSMWPWMLPPAGDPAREHLIHALAQRGASRPEVALEAASLQLRTRLLLQTDMLTLMPDVRGTIYAEQLDVVDADWCTHRRPAGIVSVRGRDQPPAVINFLDVLRTVARALRDSPDSI